MIEPESIYQVGDTVRIVDQPFRNCPFSWTYLMDRYCGTCAKITSVRWSSIRLTHAYHIDVDGGNYVWCKDCFTPSNPEPDLEETDVSLSVLFA
jgi:hypothetical protein